MPNRSLLFVLVLAALAAAAVGEAAASRSTPGAFIQPAVAQQLAEAPTARVIVSFRPPPALRVARPNVEEVRAQVAAQQASVLEDLQPSEFTVTYRYQAVPAVAGRVSKDGLEQLAGREDVAGIEIDGWGTAATTQSGPLIHAPEVHSAGLTGEGVVVAVLDSGADTDHPDLAGDIAYEWCQLSGGTCPGGAHPGEDDNGHGTNVSGIITSDGTVAPLGIAPDAKIAVYKILSSSGGGFFSDWLAALDDIITNHPEVDVVNMSLQSGVACPSTGLATAIGTLRARGTSTFIAAGNHGDKHELDVPGCIADAFSVGAAYDSDVGQVDGWKTPCSDVTTTADQVACWSDSDPTLDLLAPGARITSTGRGGGTSTYNGTSQASPHAAAVAALLLDAFPGLPVDELEARLKATGQLVTDDLEDADPGTNRTTPRVDARVALLQPNEDYDGDGCRNGQELGSDPRKGGMRNPLSPWDFMDVNGDRVINILDDILAVIFAFGPETAGNYEASLDRSPAPPGAEPWQQGPPDGSINLTGDILGAASQFGHSCAD